MKKKKGINKIGITKQQFRKDALVSKPYTYKGYEVLSAIVPGKPWVHCVFDKVTKEELGWISYSYDGKNDSPYHAEGEFIKLEDNKFFQQHKIIDNLQQKAMAKIALNNKRWYEFNPLSFFVLTFISLVR